MKRVLIYMAGIIPMVVLMYLLSGIGKALAFGLIGSIVVVTLGEGLVFRRKPKCQTATQ